MKRIFESFKEIESINEMELFQLAPSPSFEKLLKANGFYINPRFASGIAPGGYWINELKAGDAEIFYDSRKGEPIFQYMIYEDIIPDNIKRITNIIVPSHLVWTGDTKIVSMIKDVKKLDDEIIAWVDNISFELSLTPGSWEEKLKSNFPKIKAQFEKALEKIIKSYKPDPGGFKF